MGLDWLDPVFLYFCKSSCIYLYVPYGYDNSGPIIVCSPDLMVLVGNFQLSLAGNPVMFGSNRLCSREYRIGIRFRIVSSIFSVATPKI